MSEHQYSPELFQTILLELVSIKKQLPNGEIVTLGQDVKQVKGDITELKKRLLDPEVGIVVKVNKNSEGRALQTQHLDTFRKVRVEVGELQKWKVNVTKGLWFIFAALTALIGKILFPGAGS